MKELWEQELTHEETEAILQKLVTRVSKYKMETPAIFALEAHKPLANLGGNASLVVSPFLIPIFGYDAFNDYSRLLSKRENWERLVDLLDESRQTPKQEQKA